MLLTEIERWGKDDGQGEAQPTANDLFDDLWMTPNAPHERQQKLNDLARAIDANIDQHKSDGRPHTFLPRLE